MIWASLSLSILFFLNACSPTKYFSDKQYLLKDNKIILNEKSIDKSEVKSYSKQKPNRTILGWPIYVSLYNMVDPVKEAQRDLKRAAKLIEKNEKRIAKGKKPKNSPFYFSRWWRNSVGKTPVIFDPYSIPESKIHMGSYLRNLGYFENEIQDSVRYQIKNKRATVSYYIDEGTPFLINEFTRNITDKRVDSIVKSEGDKLYIKKSELFNAYQLDNIRYNISSLLQDNGYYGFGPDQIMFYADSMQKQHLVNIEMKLFNSSFNGDTIFQTSHFPIYYFDSISVTNYPYNLEYLKYKDPITEYFGKDSITFNYYDELHFKPYLLKRRIDLRKDSMFCKQDVSRSIRGVNGLGIFSAVNFKITPSDKISEDSLVKYLNCEIQLSPANKESYTIDLEGYTSSGAVGTGLKFTYVHKNIFKRAIYFNLSLNGKLEKFATDIGTSDDVLAYEYGINTTIRFPKFFSPFRLYKFNNKYFPNTLINVNYTFKDRSEYIRQTSSLAFGYSWSTPKGIKHNLNPIDFYLTRFKDIEYEYLKYLIDKNLYDQYFDHVIPAGNYSIFYSGQKFNVPEDFFLINLRVELAGNLLSLGKILTNAPKTGSGDLNAEVIEAYANDNIVDSLQQDYINRTIDSMNTYGPSYYTFTNILYNQYFKADIDLRYTWFLTKDISFTSRFFGGVIVPYGNTDFSPIEKQYFVGGSNDLRAWWARSVGPGVYILDDQTLQLKNYYQNGDIKLLANFELRHNLIWKINGAIFTDIGNVWNMYNNPKLPGGQFFFDTFYQQFAIGAGYGIRLDLNFFVLRFDLAFKLRDPSIPSNNKWVYSQGNKYYKKPILNFGIGYPF